MAVGGIAKKMLGYADEFMEGATKGIGSGGAIKASVNKISSNMTKGQKAALKKFGSSAGDAAKHISRAQTVTNNTKKHVANLINNSPQIPQNVKAQTINQLNQRGGLAITKAQRNAKLNGISANRVAGIQNPTTMNKIGDAVWGGVRDTAASVKGGKTVSDALAMGFKDGDKLRMDRVAGAFVAGSAAARLATGGGLYKDRNGSTNIIGIPFL